MKKLFITLITVLLLTGCGKTKAINEVVSDNDMNEGVSVDKHLFDVEITIPSSFYEDLGGVTPTQEELDASYSGDGFKSVTLNDDGSITLIMTKSQHKELLEEMKTSFDDSFKEYIDDPEMVIEDITYNDDFSKFDVVVSTNEVYFAERFIPIAFSFCSALYNVFAGNEINPIVTTFYDTKGNILEVFDFNED